MVAQIKKIIKISIFPILLILSFINYSCSPASMLATGGSSAMVVAEGERSLGTVIDDATINRIRLNTIKEINKNNILIDKLYKVFSPRIKQINNHDNQFSIN